MSPRELTTAETGSPEVAFMLLPFVEHDDVGGHPDLQHYLATGWKVRESAPRLTEGEGLKLFVVLHRDEPGA